MIECTFHKQEASSDNISKSVSWCLGAAGIHSV